MCLISVVVWPQKPSRPRDPWHSWHVSICPSYTNQRPRPQNTFYAWPRAIELNIQDACDTTGAVLAMMADNLPAPWAAEGLLTTTYKAVVLGHAARLSTTAALDAAGHTQHQCKFCNKRYTIKSSIYTEEEAEGLHTFYCPFAAPNYGKTLIQSQPNITDPLLSQGLEKCTVCMAPVQNITTHTPMCATRWLNAPKKPTATFWRYQCKVCGPVYLPGVSVNLPPRTPIDYNQADSTGKKPSLRRG